MAYTQLDRRVSNKVLEEVSFHGFPHDGCWMVYGIMGYTGYQINAQTVTIGALSLGLGVDYAVHFHSS